MFRYHYFNIALNRLPLCLRINGHANIADFTKRVNEKLEYSLKRTLVQPNRKKMKLNKNATRNLFDCALANVKISYRLWVEIGKHAKKNNHFI